jgi:hypothetical protein
MRTVYSALFKTFCYHSTNIMPEPPFMWVTDNDVFILGDYICSVCCKCKKPLTDNVQIMLFREHPEKSGRGSIDIARFHESCFGELLESGVVKLGVLHQDES